MLMFLSCIDVNKIANRILKNNNLSESAKIELVKVLKTEIKTCPIVIKK